MNSGNAPVRLRIEAADRTFSKVRELREGSESQGQVVAVPAKQTAIYEMLE